MHISDLRPGRVRPDVLAQAPSGDAEEPTAPASLVALITLAVLVLLATLA